MDRSGGVESLDGLCTFVTIVVSIFFSLVAYMKDDIEMLYIIIPMIAILCGFIIYNHYPARMFMGDTGSLLLGAYVAFMSIQLDIAYFLPLFGFIYMAEVLSVIMQVSYFKATHGKRIFKMAPIHHHFEKCGYSENKICIMFTLITVIMCIISFILIKGEIFG